MLHVEINVKFRAFGIDITKIHKSQSIPLPLELQLVAHLFGKKTLFTYNDHGVNVVLSLEG